MCYDEIKENFKRVAYMKRTETANFKLNRISYIKVSDIVTNPNQPRRDFEPSQIQSLAQSIRENGLLQPLSVRKSGKNYELIAGERRLRAIKSLGMQAAPCIIVDVDENRSAVLALVENLQREDLNPFEEALAIYELISRTGLKQTQIAEKLSISQSAVANKLRLLRLSEKERNIILKNRLTERHARAILRICDIDLRVKALNHIAASSLNVAQTEKYIDKLLSTEKSGKTRMIFKDLRIFINTINMAIETMRKSGVKASAVRGETDSFIEYTIRIPKPAEAGKN